MDTTTNIAVKDLTMRSEKLELRQHEAVDWDTSTPRDLTTHKRKAASIQDENQQQQIDNALLERLARAIQGSDTAGNNSSSVERRDGLSSQENVVNPPSAHSSQGGRGTMSLPPLPPRPQEPKKRQRYQRRNSFVIRRRQGGMLLPPGFLSEIQNFDEEAEATKNARSASPAHFLADERPRSLPDVYVGDEETSFDDTTHGWGHSSWPSLEAKLLHTRLSNLSFASPRDDVIPSNPEICLSNSKNPRDQADIGGPNDKQA